MPPPNAVRAAALRADRATPPRAGPFPRATRRSRCGRPRNPAPAARPCSNNPSACAAAPALRSRSAATSRSCSSRGWRSMASRSTRIASRPGAALPAQPRQLQVQRRVGRRLPQRLQQQCIPPRRRVQRTSVAPPGALTTAAGRPLRAPGLRIRPEPRGRCPVVRAAARLESRKSRESGSIIAAHFRYAKRRHPSVANLHSFRSTAAMRLARQLCPRAREPLPRPPENRRYSQEKQ